MAVRCDARNHDLAEIVGFCWDEPIYKVIGPVKVEVRGWGRHRFLVSANQGGSAMLAFQSRMAGRLFDRDAHLP